MIFEVQDYSLIFRDILYSLAVGFGAGFINQLLGIFFHRGKILLFVKDILMWAVFTGLVFSYAVSFANYPVMRWYNMAGAAVGFFLFFPRFSHAVNRLRDRRIFALCRGAKSKISALFSAASAICVKIFKKYQKFTIKSNKELLQSDSVLLYN